MVVISVASMLLAFQILLTPLGLEDQGVHAQSLNGSKVPAIPLGKWEFNSNGLTGTLNVTSIDSKGRLNGTIELYPRQAITPIRGYFDGLTGKISFVRTLGKNVTDIEIYSGYKFANVIADCIDGTGPGSCYQLSKMAGTFDSFVDHQTNGTEPYLNYSDSKRNTFGWSASHIPLPCSECPR